MKLIQLSDNKRSINKRTRGFPGTRAAPSIYNNFVSKLIIPDRKISTRAISSVPGTKLGEKDNIDFISK